MRKNSFKIYDASAGSGKTYTLTKAYLKIILSHENSYRQILAITFTNKAVNEMKVRILNSLFNFSKVDLDTTLPSLFTELLKELSCTPKELQKKSKNTLKKILHNYAFFDISTIDKFTHRLIRTFAKDLKIPQNFEVVLDRDLLLNEAVSRLINKAGSDSKITKVLIDFALEKIDDDRSWDISLDLNKVGQLIFNENDGQHLEKFKDKSIDDFLELQKVILNKITYHKKNLVDHATQSLKIITENGLEHSDFKSGWFPKFLIKIQAGDLKIDFDAKWKQNFDSEPLYAGKCDANKRPLLDNLQPQFVSLFNRIKKTTRLYQLLNNVYKNIVPLTVLNAIQQEVKTLQNERDQLSISEFNSIISNEIKHQPAPFIYERLGEKYRHYFIDEFQDTSEMQWNNLIPLIDNALSSEFGSLFLVGDTKQAIYRWRGGKAEQFLNLVNSKTNPFVIQPEIKQLPKNFRSHEEIIKFNNDFFASTSRFLNNQIYETLFVDGNKQKYNQRKNGFVQLTFIKKNDEESTDEQYGHEVLKTIHNINSKGFSYSDICILVRGNKEGVLLANFLTQADIPIISSESLLLKSSAKIQFLVHLLHHHNQPDAVEIVFELLSFLSTNEREQHKFIATHLSTFSLFLKKEYNFDLNRIQDMSVYDTLEYAIKHFDLAPRSDAYINFFMDAVLDIEQKEGASISTFLSHWEKNKDKLSITAPSSINAVQIMTIHKSKGLEFENVIFPYANSKIYAEKDAKLWLPVEATSFVGFEEVLINKKQEVINYNTTAAEAYEDENNMLELDAFNVLYVALTRAVNALYIITSENSSPAKSDTPKNYSDLFTYFLKEKNVWEEHKHVYKFGSLQFSSENKTSEEENIAYQYSYKERDSFKILTKSGILWDTKSETAISKGNLIHFIMSLVETLNDVEKALDIVRRNGDVTENEIEPLRSTILQIVEHPKLLPFFKDGSAIKNERDIITKKGNILRPDRVVIHNNEATIIDYKTGKRDIRHKDQIDSYAIALAEMGFSIANKIVIYINEEITPEFI